MVYARTVVIDHVQGLELFIKPLPAFGKLLFGQVVLRLYEYLNRLVGSMTEAGYPVNRWIPTIRVSIVFTRCFLCGTG